MDSAVELAVTTAVQSVALGVAGASRDRGDPGVAAVRCATISTRAGTSEAITKPGPIIPWRRRQARVPKSRLGGSGLSRTVLPRPIGRVRDAPHYAGGSSTSSMGSPSGPMMPTRVQSSASFSNPAVL